MNEKNAGFARFIYPAVFSITLAAVLRAAIEYVVSRKAVFLSDGLFFALWAAFFVAIVACRALATSVLRCSVCGRFTRDALIFEQGGSARFCRDHLIERFKREFTAYTDKMVVVYPALEMQKVPFVYEYTPLTRIKAKLLRGPFGRMVTRALSSIDGQCSRCGQKATVAYFGPGNTPWETTLLSGPGNDDEIAATYQITCPSCIVDELCSSISRFEGVFSGGIILPHNGSGIFVSHSH